MTKNQIEFLKLQETKRSNQAQEVETNRANLERERQGALTLDETSRHNLATEQHNANVLIEQSRHNLATEAETAQHNRETERVAVLNYAETARANQARESIQRNTLNETIRSNQSREQLQRDTLSETQRANRALEQWRSSSLYETIRSDQAKEAAAQASLNETIRNNTAMLDYRNRQLEEQHRAAIVDEATRAAAQITNAGYLVEQVRSDLAKEAETSRHHLAMELSYATKDFGTHVSLDASPVITNSNSAPSLPATTDKQQKALPGSSNQTANAKTPVLVRTEVVSQPYQGVAGEASGLFTGNNVQIVREYYSDGSSKYYEEVIRHGKIVSRKQISSKS